MFNKPTSRPFPIIKLDRFLIGSVQLRGHPARARLQVTPSHQPQPSSDVDVDVDADADAKRRRGADGTPEKLGANLIKKISSCYMTLWTK